MPDIIPRNINPPSNEPSPISSSSSPDVDVNLYLQSPIETLLESSEDQDAVYVSVHDVIEAYNLFSNRIQANMEHMAKHDLALPLLQRHSTVIAGVINRDIRRIFYDPASTDGEEAQHVRHSIMLCHQALRLLSDIFRFPALYQCFDDQKLHSFMTLVMSISGLGPSEAPALCQNKTIFLAIWLLKIQRLPPEVIVPIHRDIVSVLCGCIRGDAGLNKALTDGLQAADNLLQRHPHPFLNAFAESIPHILGHVVSESPEVRAHAVSVLGAFAFAKLRDGDVSPILGRISDQVLSFIDNQALKQKRSEPTKRLGHLLMDAVAVADITQAGSGPLWALCLIASLIVLADGQLFSHSRTIKTIIPPIAMSLSHRSSSVRALHTHVWNCLVWAFGRISGSLVDIRSKAFLFVKQDLRRGIGTALVSLLLPSAGQAVVADSDTDENVVKALQVLKDMAEHKNTTITREGLQLLVHLIASSSSDLALQPGDPDQWCNVHFLPKSLFDGTILRAKPDRLSVLLHSLASREGCTVRVLTEQEILSHWHTLLGVWARIVHSLLENSSDDDLQTQGQVLHCWQTLLLVQAEFTQERGHFTTGVSLQSDITQTVSDFVVASASSSKPGLYLFIVKRLFGVMKNVFSGPCIKEIAESILCEVIKQTYDFKDAKIEEAWFAVCVELVSTGIQRNVEIVVVMAQELHVKRRLWAIFAKTWQTADEKADWEVMVQALAVPFRAWAMSPVELELWEELLRTTITAAGQSDIRPAIAIIKFLQYLGEQSLALLSEYPKVVLAIMSQVNFAEPESFLACHLPIICSTLGKLYPPPPEALPIVLQLLQVVHEVVLSTSASSILSVLRGLQECLCPWITDEKTILSDEQYNNLVMPIYCSALEILKSLPPSVDILHDLSDFLTSAFTRVPSPALGPIAFRSYWKATFHGREAYVAAYPESLKQCLRAFDDVAGGDLAVGFSADTTSELTATPHSVVPSSQSPYGKALGKAHEAYRSTQSRWPNPDTVLVGGEESGSWFASSGSDKVLSTFARSRKSPVSSPSHEPSRALLDLRQYSSQTQSEKQASMHTMPDEVDGPLRDLFPDSAICSQGKRIGTSLGSQPKRRRTVTEPGEYFSSPENPRNAGFYSNESPQFSAIRQASSSLEDEDDYDSWEVGMSSQDISVIQRELSSGREDEGRILGQGMKYSSSPEATSMTTTEPVFAADHHSEHSPTAKHRRDRSQTEPQEILHTSSDAEMSRQRIPLKRNQTTSARLEALQRAYTLVQDDASQLPVEDLVQAARLVHRIGDKLNEQMSKKLKKDK